MKEQAEIDAFIRSQHVASTPVVDGESGDLLLSQGDALFLLTSIVQDGGPMMSYLDVYSLGTDGTLTFVDDLTEVDIHEMQQPDEDYKANLVRYLAQTDAAVLIAMTDFYAPKKPPTPFNDVSENVFFRKLQKSVSQGRSIDEKDVET